MLGRLISNIKQKVSGLWNPVGGGYSFASYMRSWGVGRTRRELLDLFTGLVHQCITAISSNVSRYEPVVEKKDAKGNTVQVLENPLLSLLERPNPFMTTYELIEASETYRMLTGEFFWYLALGEQTRKPKEIYIVRPDRVKVAIDKETGDVSGYTIRRDDGTELALDIDEMVHYKEFNPVNPYRGLGIVEANLLYIETENESSSFQYNYMKNQATPSGVLTFRADNKQTIDREAFEKAKIQWDEQYSGAGNAGKTLFVREMDVKFEKVGLSLADLDMAELKKLTDEKVREAFRVPKAMLGETDSTGLGRANIEAIEYIFAKYTIDPVQDKWDDFLTQMMHRFWPQLSMLKVKHISQVPEDKEFKLKQMTEGHGKWVMTNEVRKYYGMPEVPGGDQLYYDFNQIPIEANSTRITDGGETKKLKIVLKKDEPATPVKDVKKKLSEEGFFTALSRIENATQNAYAKEIKSLLEKQEKIVLDRLEAYVGKNIEEITPDENEEAAAWILALAPFLIRAIEKAGPLGLQLMGVDDQIEFLITQGARESVYSSGTRLLRSFNQETTDKIQKQLIAGINNGESLKELQARVESVYKEAKGYRAKRIANTESHRATNYGIRESYRQAGVKKMEWRANPGACEFCQAMDGTVVSIGASFLSQGQTIEGTDGGSYVADYDDVALADLHPNCTCTIVPVVD